MRSLVVTESTALSSIMSCNGRFNYEYFAPYLFSAHKSQSLIRGIITVWKLHLDIDGLLLCYTMTGLYVGRRLSYDGHLCTVRYIGPLTDTKGDWLGVEWDEVTRGKHNGQHKGRQIFSCLAYESSGAQHAGSFLRTTRSPDLERTVLDAIKYKYGALSQDATDEIVISGKIAEEIGFEKIARRQSQLSDLRIALLDGLVVQGLAPRYATPEQVVFHRQELRKACPNVAELDVGYNVIESWEDVADICLCFSKLRVLRAGYVHSIINLIVCLTHLRLVVFVYILHNCLLPSHRYHSQAFTPYT